MVKRINAFRIVFNFLLSVVELLIGVRFLVELFGSSQSSFELFKTVKLVLGQMSLISSASLVRSGIETPITILLMVLGFMLFSFVMITAVPVMTIRKERELELAED